MDSKYQRDLSVDSSSYGSGDEEPHAESIPRAVQMIPISRACKTRASDRKFVESSDNESESSGWEDLITGQREPVGKSDPRSGWKEDATASRLILSAMNNGTLGVTPVDIAGTSSRKSAPRQVCEQNIELHIYEPQLSSAITERGPALAVPQRGRPRSQSF